ncbi:TniB family NTP-binding protein [Chryseobacterium arthrosphaerae]|uniref:TniB family NTP-binding protein n=1 Tax=Chryseobacterium arthrosphaerae TaxID=651561 RepID=UPI002414E956|nr:TniB family NTP-binding protein [Chryseobacterium arthrosphaerae]MDG4653743.1 TniB family NTP-binding protein [Chryseobacterium arthrosphaerae]
MMKHLTTKTKELVLNGSLEEKIFHLRKQKWIPYPNADKILAKLDDLKNYPTVDRMPNLLIVGETNNGKTALINRFYKKNNPYIRKGEYDVVIAPVLVVQAPAEPDEKSFYNKILQILNAPIIKSESPDIKQRRIISLFKKLEVKLIIVDEIHHVLAGSPLKQRIFLNVLKYLSNELKIPIICVGIRDAFNVIQSDSQLSNRFETVILERWKMNDVYLQFLVNYEALLPLENPSYLAENSMASKILAMSDGLIGEINTILIKAAELALNSGLNKIDHKILDNIEYVSPEDRKKILRRANL